MLSKLLPMFKWRKLMIGQCSLVEIHNFYFEKCCAWDKCLVQSFTNGHRNLFVATIYEWPCNYAFGDKKFNFSYQEIVQQLTSIQSAMQIFTSYFNVECPNLLATISQTFSYVQCSNDPQIFVFWLIKFGKLNLLFDEENRASFVRFAPQFKNKVAKWLCNLLLDWKMVEMFDWNDLLPSTAFSVTFQLQCLKFKL